MSRYLLLLGSALALSSCAYLLDESIQTLTVLTPGAKDSVCYVYVDDVRYEAHPPQVLHISKSSKDMTVDCLAPGNRRRKIFIEPAVSKHERMNIVNGIVPGAVWDAASGAFYSYPDTITVDFTSAAINPEPMPPQNNPDIKQPEEYNLEEFSSGLPRLNSDRYNEGTPVRRRQHETSAPAGYSQSTITEHEGPGKPPDKGDLDAVIKNLNGNMNPSGATSTSTAPAAAPASAQAPAGDAPVTSTSAPKAVMPAPSTQTFGPSAPSSDKVGPPVPIYPGQ